MQTNDRSLKTIRKYETVVGCWLKVLDILEGILALALS
jgi:hypothetical protein